MNSDYVAASGHTSARLQQNNVTWVHIIPCLELTTRYIEERLATYLRAGLNTLTYVHRTEVWKTMFKDTHLISDKWLGSELLPCALSALSGKIANVLKSSLYPAVAQHSEWMDETVHNNLFSVLTTQSHVRSTKVVRGLILQHLIEGGMSPQHAREFYDREIWLHVLLLLTQHFMGAHPNLNSVVGQYCHLLEKYPFSWRRPKLGTSLTEEPNLLSLFKKGDIHGKSDPS
jgi:hypothetical protein